jgi:hypothetical protein
MRGIPNATAVEPALAINSECVESSRRELNISEIIFTARVSAR